MIKNFLSGFATGMGIVAGVMVFIMLMQISAAILIKLGFLPL